MRDYKNDFGVYDTHPDLVYLDTTATALKPKSVVEAVARFSTEEYANIHRGAYDLSEASEIRYEQSKKDTAHLINAESSAEIVYTYNSTYALNYLALALRRAGRLARWDRILLSVAEHHANVVPWHILAEDLGIELVFVDIDEEYDIDYDDFARKYDARVKVVALTAVSNVTGKIFSLEKIRPMIGADTLFVVDASQAVPNYAFDVQSIDCDFAFFTAHKLYAETGLGILYGRERLLRELPPAFGGGGAINWVHEERYMPAGLPYRHEPGTPHIIGAVSLSAAISYLDSIGGYDTIAAAKKPLVERALERLESFPYAVELIGPRAVEGRAGVLSHVVPGVHLADLAEFLAERDICVRVGHHCAEPLMRFRGVAGALRASIGIYSTLSDIDRFYDALEQGIKTLG